MLTGTIWPGARDDTEPTAHGLDSWPAGKTGLPGERWGGGCCSEASACENWRPWAGWGLRVVGNDTHGQMERMKLL